MKIEKLKTIPKWIQIVLTVILKFKYIILLIYRKSGLSFACFLIRSNIVVYH